MLKHGFSKVLFLILTVIFISTCTNDDEVKICVNRCSTSQPWKVESLDLNLPCFSTEVSCNEWAVSHGYSGKRCVKCD